MREDNLNLGKKLANICEKEYGAITYSGTLAFELVLRSLRLKASSKILIADNVCYSLINTIKNCGLIPLIVHPENDFTLCSNDIEKCKKTNDIDAIVIVHQYGIANDVKSIRKIFGKGIIIEDIAQAWNIKFDDYLIGEYSDYIITSFGLTKPLNYGVGGAVFSNNNNFLKYLDFGDNNSRESNNTIYSYAYPLCKMMDIEEIIKKGNSTIKEQRRNVEKFIRIFKTQKTIKYFIDKSKFESVWNRFPIWVENKSVYNKLIFEFKQNNIQFQLQHNLKLSDLFLSNDSIKINIRDDESRIILLRTKNIDEKLTMINLKKIVKQNNY